MSCDLHISAQNLSLAEDIVTGINAALADSETDASEVTCDRVEKGGGPGECGAKRRLSADHSEFSASKITQFLSQLMLRYDHQMN